MTRSQFLGLIIEWLVELGPCLKRIFTVDASLCGCFCIAPSLTLQAEPQSLYIYLFTKSGTWFERKLWKHLKLFVGNWLSNRDISCNLFLFPSVLTKIDTDWNVPVDFTLASASASCRGYLWRWCSRLLWSYWCMDGDGLVTSQVSAVAVLDFAAVTDCFDIFGGGRCGWLRYFQRWLLFYKCFQRWLF